MNSNPAPGPHHPPHAYWAPTPVANPAPAPAPKKGIGNATFYSVLAAAAVAVVVAGALIWINLRPADPATNPSSSVAAAGSMVEAPVRNGVKTVDVTDSSVDETSAATSAAAADPFAAESETALASTTVETPVSESLATTETPTAAPTVTGPPVTVTSVPPPVTVTAPAPAVTQAPSGGSGDLGLSTPISRPACDGTAVVFLFAAVTPGSYATDIQRALDQFPGASYLRTDQSCSSLYQATDAGNPIYAVYRVAGRDLGTICSAVYAAPNGSYAKWLDNTTSPAHQINC